MASKLIVIGGSSGSFEALSVILPAFSANPPTPPALVVVHIPPDRPSGMAQLFDARCAASMREAEDKEALQPGTVYFAPPNYHLMVARDGWISLSVDPPVNFCRPSIDVLFDSAGTAFGDGVTAILLSGANQDGAAGLASIAAVGGGTIVQDPECALSPTMPAAGLRSCPAAAVMTVDEIAALIARLT
jgi:two-component system, chemotaxis family, protein-glutamate methylesterase/glutaminase